MPSSPTPRRASRLLGPIVLLALSYALLGLAWVVGDPPGQPPDETSHYLKALAVSRGELAGDRVSLPPEPTDGKEAAWVKRTARSVDIPAGLSPAGLECSSGNGRRSAACQYGISPPRGPTTRLSTVGTAQPTTYLLPGLLARLADNPVTAIQLGRLASAILSVGLVIAAAALLWDPSRGAASLIGLMAAVTPMVVFLGSSLTASGPEVTAGVCFFAALLRVTRRSATGGWPWAAVAVSGAVLAASRTLGPLWIAIDVTVIVMARGPGPSWRTARDAGTHALWALGAVGLGVILGLGWELAVQPHGALDAHALRGALRPSYHELHRVLGELIGVFGGLDTVMPAFAYVFWWVGLAVLGLTALWVGRWRQRVVLLLMVAGAVPLTLAISTLNLAQTGYGMQGRYVLPVLVALPLFAGEMLAQGRPQRGRSHVERLLVPFALVVGVVQAVGWYANARRSAVGVGGSWLFMRSSEWTPRFGWYPTAALVVLATVAVIVLAVVSWRAPHPLDRHDESLR